VSSTPGVPATQTTRGISIVRIALTAWWPRFLVAGVALTVVGVTLLSGAAHAVVALGIALIFVFAAMQGLMGRSWNQDRKRDPAVPSGSGAPIQS
jgi:hypothetical protein